MSTKAAQIRARLADDRPLVMPGVYDALSARIAARAGFEVLFVSGYAVSATQLGAPDFGLLTQTEMATAASRVCRAVDLPVIVDADTGYGNAVNVVRTVEDLARVGAAGVFLEDQVWPKRCGHMRGKRVVPAAEHAQKIRAAVHARGAGDCFIVARTDARAAVGLDDAIARALTFKDAGADALFVEAPESLDELREIGRRLPPPLVANMVEGGVTPLLPAAELAALGFRLVVYPLAGLLAAAQATADVLTRLCADGDTAAVRARLLAFAELNDLLGLDAAYALDAAFKAE